MSRTFASRDIGALACVVFLSGTSVFGTELIHGPEPIEAGPHHRVMQQVWRVLDPKGQPSMATNWYVELATGLNWYDDVAKRWVTSKAEFELARSGHFIVRQTQYKVILSPNPTEKGAVDLLTPDGVRLPSTILGVAVVDPASGASALLAEVKQSRPQWISPNQVIYPDAFDDVKADIRYTVGPDQFEQDLILRQQIPPEIILAAGLDPETARVAVLTEFFDPPSTPAHPRNTPARKRANGDEDIVFGAMTIGNGQAFSIGPNTASEQKQVRMGRSFEVLDGRKFLVEFVDYPDLGVLMETLPMPGRAHRHHNRPGRIVCRQGVQLRPGHLRNTQGHFG